MTHDQYVYRLRKGDILPERVVIHDNVYRIPQRLREIDSGYFVCYNIEAQNYELHHEGQDFTYCLTFPFHELDSRAIDYTRKTRIERIEITRRAMEENNCKIKESQKRTFDDNIEVLGKEIFRHAIRTDDGAIDPGAYKTKFI